MCLSDSVSELCVYFHTESELTLPGNEVTVEDAGGSTISDAVAAKIVERLIPTHNRASRS